MKLRAVDIEMDYTKLSLWWTARNLPPIPKVILRCATGMIVEHRDIDIACGWVYFDETRTLGVVDWITTNPTFSTSSCLPEAIGHLLAFFQDFATNRGCHNLMSFVSKDTGLHRQYVKHGWQDPKSEAHIYLFKSWQLQQ